MKTKVYKTARLLKQCGFNENSCERLCHDKCNKIMIIN